MNPSLGPQTKTASIDVCELMNAEETSNVSMSMLSLTTRELGLRTIGPCTSLTLLLPMSSGRHQLRRRAVFVDHEQRPARELIVGAVDGSEHRIGDPILARVHHQGGHVV